MLYKTAPVVSTKIANLPSYITSDPPPDDLAAEGFMALFRDKHIRTAGIPLTFQQLLRIRLLGAEFTGPLDELASLILKDLDDGTLVKLENAGDDWYVFDPKNRHNLACARRDDKVTKWKVPAGAGDGLFKI